MTWQTQDTRRQRQRTGGQSGRLRRIDSKGRPHPRWLSLRVWPCVGSRGLLASLRAHNIPAGEGRTKGAPLRIARSFPSQTASRGFPEG